MNNDRIVSFSDEPLILVDSQDNITGYMTKEDCHRDDGVLHRAFSIFLFNEAGHLLIQKRSLVKTLWGGYWSNSVCSHPRRGESYESATRRRLHDELGVSTNLTYLFRFQYQARFGPAGSENELCAVYAGRCDGPFYANATEIAELKFISPEELNRQMIEKKETFTPWFKQEWSRINDEFMDVISAV